MIHSREVSYFNMEYLREHISIDNALSKCLLHRFPREVVERVTEMYCLGHDEHLLHFEHTWFPTIDSLGRCHNIKVQGYCTNPDVPQFAHSVKGQTMWLAAYLQKRGLLDKEAVYGTGGLFQPWPPSRPPQRGEAHLRTGVSEMYNEKMNSYPTSTTSNGQTNSSPTSTMSNGLTSTSISSTTSSGLTSTSPLGEAGVGRFILVESPKNAVVGACWTMTYRPELNVTWVAVGNKGMLKRSVLEPLRGKRVIVIPDRDAIDEWKTKLAAMRDLATFVFSSFCDCDVDQENGKLDIADLMLK